MTSKCEAWWGDKDSSVPESMSKLVVDVRRSYKTIAEAAWNASRADALEEAAQVICPFCKETKTSAFFALPAVNGTHEIRTTLDNQPAGWNKPCRAAAIRALKEGE